MKKCDKCQMTVDAEQVCPYCKNDITLAEFFESKEKIVLNKYYFLYLVKQLWCSVLVTPIIIYLLMTNYVYDMKYVYTVYGILILGYFYGFFERPFLRFYQKYFSSSYIGSFNYRVEKSKITGPLAKYILPIVSLLFTIFLVAMSKKMGM